MLVRILTAAVGLPLLLAIVLLLPPIGTAVLFGLACMIAAYEMLWRTRLWRNKGAVVLTALMGAAVILWSWCKGCGILTGEQLWLSALVGLFVFFSILFCQLLAGHGKVKVQSIAAVLFAGFVYPFMLGALVRLRSKKEENKGSCVETKL